MSKLFYSPAGATHQTPGRYCDLAGMPETQDLRAGMDFRKPEHRRVVTPPEGRSEQRHRIDRELQQESVHEERREARPAERVERVDELAQGGAGEARADHRRKRADREREVGGEVARARDRLR